MNTCGARDLLNVLRITIRHGGRGSRIAATTLLFTSTVGCREQTQPTTNVKTESRDVSSGSTAAASSGGQSSNPNGGTSATATSNGGGTPSSSATDTASAMTGTESQPSSASSGAVADSASTNGVDTGSSDGRGDPTEPTVVVTRPTTVEEFWAQWPEVVCAYGERCNGYAQGATCQAVLRDRVGSMVSFASAFLSLDLTAAYECLQAYAGPSCPPDNDLLNEGLGEVCPRFLIGTQSVGGPCQHDVECAAGCYCNTYDSCPGDCRPTAGLTEDCSDKPCEPGSSCVTGDVCAPDLPQGATCDAGDSARAAHCMLNTSCHGGTCVAVRPHVLETGDLCWREDECKGGARCVNGTCEALAELGEPCDVRYCAPRLFCDAVSTSCQPEKEPGDTCTQETECAFGSACSDGYCKAKSGLGESCTNDYWCHSGYCVNQRCELSQLCGD